MRPSVVVKKLISVAALGLALFITFCTTGFFLFMGWEFGYKDLQCKQFPETRKFADELTNTLIALESSAYWVENYENSIPQETISITEMYYDGSFVNLYNKKTYRLKDWLNSQDYFFYTDGYNVTEVYLDSNENYNDDWYSIALDSRTVKVTSDFYVISREDYIDLLLSHANPNSTVVDGFSDEDFENFIADEENGLENYDGTEVTTEGGIQYIDASFSANSYIGYYDGVVFVYSPEEDMFYSSLYGWYTIPDYLYFPEKEGFGNDIELLFCQFTSKEEILEQKIGTDYLDYVREVENLLYEQRSIAYYTVSDKQVYSNIGSLDKLVNCNLYLCIKPTASGEYTVEFHNFDNVYLTDEYVTGIVQCLEVLKPDEGLYVGIYTTYPYDDVFSEGNQIFKDFYPYTIPALVIAIIMGIISVIMLIGMLRSSGKVSKDDETIHLTVIDKIPIEIILAAMIIGFCILVVQCYNQLESAMYYRYVDEFLFNISFASGYILMITGLLSLVRRGKKRQLFEQSLVRWLFLLGKKLVSSISRQKNLMARVVELFLLYWMVTLFGLVLVMSGYSWLTLIGLMIIAILNVTVLVLMLWQAKGEQSVRDATKALAEGDLEYKTKPMKRLGTEQEIIDNIEHLSDGLQKAVEKSIYDERMKAELITNVSHDIKTPLTSIINYVDLIKREHIDNENVLHYIEVLDRKSWRLKQLTEDLVEVSKITTGNIELERVPIDFGELLRQTLGEFEDKFAEQELQIVDSIQEQSYMIFADGRRTFRILENLFQNIYKYAMPKTRVYVDLKNEKERIELSIKNISKAPLNIDAKELMERFVRGDQSRTTEGSGLGLSIAQDLVKLQDGEFQIYLDGDLFKVMITFPEFISQEIVDMEEKQEGLEDKTVAAIEKAEKKNKKN